jgi:integrase
VRGAQRFTPNYLTRLDVKPKPYRVYDNHGDGLGAQIHPSGRVAFFVAWRAPGSTNVRTLTIGAFPILAKTAEKEAAIDAARAKAKELRRERRAGLDPVEQETQRNVDAQRQEREAIEARARESAIGSVGALFAAYVNSLKQRGARSWQETERALTGEALPRLGRGTKAKDVTPLDVRAALLPIVARGARHYANRVRGYMHAAFAFGVADDLGFDKPADAPMFGLLTNPVRDVPKPLKNEKVGERALTEVEFKRLWAALCDVRAFGPWSRLALRLILLAGGQRIQETLRAEWQHFDDAAGVWTMPAGTTKNARPHAIPITPAMAEVLAEIKRHASLKPAVDAQLSTGRQLNPNAQLLPTQQLIPKGQLFDTEKLVQGARLFPGADGEGARFRTINRALRRWIEKTAKDAEKARREGAADVPAPVAQFVARDLRRTVKTLMGDLGIPKPVRDQLMNHAQSADVASRHYDRSLYLPEKRAALEMWAAWIASDKTIRDFRAALEAPPAKSKTRRKTAKG